MTRFRLQNYKNVNDSGWINCERLTAFVGKNESGKSAIFRGLSKLNPSDLEKYDGLREFPRDRYSDEYTNKDWPVSSAEFQLSDSETRKLQEICPLLGNVKSVKCTRTYKWSLIIEFEAPPQLPDVSYGKYIEALKKWQTLIEELVAPEGKGEQLAPTKQQLLQFMTQKIHETTQHNLSDGVVDRPLIDEVSVTLNGKVTETWLKELITPLIEEVNQFKTNLENMAKITSAKQWVQDNLPKFVYFQEYDVIDSAIHFPTFVQQLKQTPSAPRVRTTKCLFEHVGLDINKIQSLDPNNPQQSVETLQKFADERMILMSSASNAMTKRFSDWWEQRKHKFHYKTDGNFFRVWVSDNLDQSEIELDQRSYGMRYFFSFYLVFLQEAKGAYSNSILLLDEPGLHLHGTAQRKIVEFFEKLAHENQLLYSTHSPFMINPDYLERVRVVYDDKEGHANISEDVWPKDEESLFPLQAGLGYSVAQTLFYSKRQLVVEGLTDYSYLKTINELLSKKNRTTFREDAVIVPTGGIRNLLPLASMLLGNEIKIAILLDGDETGKQKSKEMQEKLLAKCLLVNAFSEKDEAEIEDLFPEQLYIDAVKEAYPNVKDKIQFSENEKKIQCVSKRTAELFKKIDVKFEKWRPEKVIRDWIHEKPDLITEETLERFEGLFKEANRVLS